MFGERTVKWSVGWCNPVAPAVSSNIVQTFTMPRHNHSRNGFHSSASLSWVVVVCCMYCKFSIVSVGWDSTTTSVQYSCWKLQIMTCFANTCLLCHSRFSSKICHERKKRGQTLKVRAKKSASERCITSDGFVANVLIVKLELTITLPKIIIGNLCRDFITLLAPLWKSF